MTKETRKDYKIFFLILELYLLNSKNKFLGDSSDPIKDFFYSWSQILSNLNSAELSALTHILSSILMLLCLFTIMGVIYSEFLLNYFKLEAKYPRIGQYLRYRKAFQQYYLFVNFTIIIIILLALIFINSFVLI